MSGTELLSQSNQTRESGQFSKSLELSDQSIIAFSEENNPAQFAETLAARSLTLRHLYQKSGDRNYLIVAKAEMHASLEIAKSLDDRTALAIPLFNLAKVYEELEEIEDSIKFYKEAIEAMEQNPPDNHNRPGVLADFKIHLATVELKNGDKSARDRLEEALSDLEKSDEDSFNKNVWLSGAHMNLANLLKDNDLESSQFHLQQAKQIIDSDKRLILRKNQWEKLTKTIN